MLSSSGNTQVAKRDGRIEGASRAAQGQPDRQYRSVALDSGEFFRLNVWKCTCSGLSVYLPVSVGVEVSTAEVFHGHLKATAMVMSEQGTNPRSNNAIAVAALARGCGVLKRSVETDCIGTGIR